MRAYFVVSFLAMAVLAGAIAVNAWITGERTGLWPLQVAAVVPAIVAIWSLWMTLVAAVSRYRK